MTSKQELRDLMSDRSPLARETVTPVSPYAVEPASGLASNTASPEPGKPTSPQVVKYTTRLEPALIKWVKREALEREISDYEIVQQALEEFRDRQASKPTNPQAA
ncbi:hypothetical protein [Streptacidiphilus cavernicola]|uniref:CopG family transcriptional regulator n=1 Tax=Streptacidiphilus cavernicola TaxID=3342716 RepID=A0ABV6W048_9ACTN